MDGLKQGVKKVEIEIECGAQYTNIMMCTPIQGEIVPWHAP